MCWFRWQGIRPQDARGPSFTAGKAKVSHGNERLAGGQGPGQTGLHSLGHLGTEGHPHSLSQPPAWAAP